MLRTLCSLDEINGSHKKRFRCYASDNGTKIQQISDNYKKM